MSSAKTTFTVKETVSGAFKLTQELNNVVTVIGTYKSKSYAVKKLKQLSFQVQNPSQTYFFEKIVGLGDEWVTSEHIISELTQIQETETELHQDVIQSEVVSAEHEQASSANITRSACENCAASVANAPPVSNTGGLTETENVATTEFSVEDDDLPDFLKTSQVYEEIKNLQISESYQQIVMENGQPKQIMLRRGLKTPAFIDTLSFTINEVAFFRVERTLEPDFSQHGKIVEKKREIQGEEALAEGLAEFIKIMGLKVIGEGAGRNGYQSSILLGNKDEGRNYGFVAFGGHNQNGSVMFHLTGEGLAMARQGWELMLYAWLKKHEKVAKITRVDIAHDMLFGGYKVEQAVEDWKNDCYTVRQTRPHCEIQGVDWLSGTKKGKTAYIGSKKSSRILYFYEKGKQLGDEDSDWVRIELRQRNKDYVIPFDVLLHAGDYLCTAYPHLSKVLSYDFSEQYVFERIKKQNGVAIEHVVKYAKMQVSPAIKMLKSLGLSEEEIVSELFNNRAKMPKRLILKNLEEDKTL